MQYKILTNIFCVYKHTQPEAQVKIGFILDAPFHVLSVLQDSVSDAEAAVAYLAIELAKLGHNITIFSNSTNKENAFNVRCKNINIANNTLNLDKAILEPDFDALIIKNNSPEFLISIKKALPYTPKMYLWTAYDYTSPINKGLSNPNNIEEIAGIICVSEWQRSRIMSKLNVPREKLHVKLYAISHFFENMFLDGKELFNNKSKMPALAYTAKQADGLDYLIETFGDVYNNYPEANLSIFVDLPDNISLPARNKNIQTIGEVLPEQLATILRTHTILTYPCVQESTSYTAVLEAMAAGLYVITSNEAALPEYCEEHGKCIKAQNLHTDKLDSFIGQLLAVCQTQVHSPSMFYDYCFKQIIDINKSHTWRVRAAEWVELLNK